jgi:hypothetical protein
MWHLSKGESLECDCMSDDAIEIGYIQGEGVSLCHHSPPNHMCSCMVSADLCGEVA